MNPLYDRYIYFVKRRYTLKPLGFAALYNSMELQALREIISEKYLGYAGIHAVGTKDGKITVYYEQF